MKPQVPFWLITIALLIGITVPVLIQDGMFMDAMLYTSVSHNLSEGIGTFWFPQFSVLNMSGLTSFHEQPPLVFGIQALFYKVLGDSLYTERIYVFIAMCITAWLIHTLWREVCKDEALKKMSWLPIIVWITIPDCYWSFSKNMLENTMGIFVLISALFAIRALMSDRFKTGKYILSGIFIFLATLSKGVPGFFTIAIPFVYWISTRKITFKRMVSASVIMAIVPVIIYCVLLLFHDSRESLSMYFFKRLLGRINNEHSVSSRFDIVWHIFSELIPQIGLMIVVLLLTGIKKMRTLLQLENTSMIMFFALTGLAGSLPIMLTHVQSGFYIVPSYPFFAIAIGLFIAILIVKPVNSISTEGKGYKMFTAFSVLALVAVITISIMQIGKTYRDKAKLHDVYAIGKIMPRYSTVSVPPDLWNDWELQCYLIRYFNISIDPQNKMQYYVEDRQNKDVPPVGYTKLDIGLQKYDLYKR